MGTIAVIGLGSSWRLFEKDKYDLSIGVNDIWRYVQTDVIVCVDIPGKFPPDRLKIINNSKPKVFYSHTVKWDHREDFKKIELIKYYPDNYLDLDLGYWKSYCSPFIAVQVAFREYKASEIHLFGVDLVNHPYLDRELCRKIQRHFINLKTALDKKECKLIVKGDGILKKTNIQILKIVKML